MIMGIQVTWVDTSKIRRAVDKYVIEPARARTYQPVLARTTNKTLAPPVSCERAEQSEPRPQALSPRLFVYAEIHRTLHSPSIELHWSYCCVLNG